MNWNKACGVCMGVPTHLGGQLASQSLVYLHPVYNKIMYYVFSNTCGEQYLDWQQRMWGVIGFVPTMHVRWGKKAEMGKLEDGTTDDKRTKLGQNQIFIRNAWHTMYIHSSILVPTKHSEFSLWGDWAYVDHAEVAGLHVWPSSARREVYMPCLKTYTLVAEVLCYVQMNQLATHV